MQISNPILSQISNPRNSQSQIPNQQIQQIKDLMQQVKTSPNPNLMLQNIIKQNPNLQLLMGNGSLQQVAQVLAQQKGVDLNLLIQQLIS